MNTTSFPYLDIATRHGVPYGLVIRYVQLLDDGLGSMIANGPLWLHETETAWLAEKWRRKQQQAKG